MAKRRRKNEPLPTIWNVPDELWELIVPILDTYDPRAPTGRPRVRPSMASSIVCAAVFSGTNSQASSAMAVRFIARFSSG